MSNGVDKIPELLHAIELVNDAIALTEKALVDNPSIDEERELNIKLARLKARLAVLDAELDAALAGDSSVQAPTQAQLAQMESLSANVEQAANQSVAGRIAVIAKVLDLASAVIGIS